MNKIIANNQVCIEGEVVSDFSFSHEVFGEGFYMLNVSIKRLSDSCDIIPIMVSERLFDVHKNYTGIRMHVEGQFRSYNSHENNKSRLKLYIFAREINFVEDEAFLDYNYIFLNGFICKEPVYRKTPLGREIADVLLAVNRPYGKSDYIPCICWGRNAHFVSRLNVGTHMEVKGRVQSRKYIKRFIDKESEQRVAYEVSVSKVILSDT